MKLLVHRARHELGHSLHFPESRNQPSRRRRSELLFQKRNGGVCECEETEKSKKSGDYSTSH